VIAKARAKTAEEKREATRMSGRSALTDPIEKSEEKEPDKSARLLLLRSQKIGLTLHR
jgi:hypothetical protein